MSNGNRPSFEPCRDIMKREGINDADIAAFEANFYFALNGNDVISESSVSPVRDLLEVENIRVSINRKLLDRTVICKLNGEIDNCLGSMKAKGLLNIKEDDSFIDMAVKQVLTLRQEFNCYKLKLLLMNSYKTSDETLSYIFSKYPNLLQEDIELLQSKIPKIHDSTFQPLGLDGTDHSSDVDEWCLPGHGELFSSLIGSGRLDSLLQEGYKYMFVSNIDNAGASIDLNILTHFAGSGSPFMMECCKRNERDRTAGHICIRNSDMRIILREKDMCAKDNYHSIIGVHRFCNTNNLWIRLDVLKEVWRKFPPRLPSVKYMNSVNDNNIKNFVQLKISVGTAIEFFSNSTAICVPRVSLRKRYEYTPKCCL